MGAQRKYLDRGRRIPREGRPYAVEWLTLLAVSLVKGRDGRADDAMFLSEVMWEGVSGPRFPRPALLDHPFLRSVQDLTDLDAQENELRQQAKVLRKLLDSPDCIAAGEGAHFMTGYGASISEGQVTWSTGLCARCLGAILLRIDLVESSVKAWPFYDQEAEYAGVDTT